VSIARRLVGVAGVLGLATLPARAADAQGTSGGGAEPPPDPRVRMLVIRQGGIERTVRVVSPTTALPAARRTLLVFLHGCTQDATDVARGTGLDAAADALGVIVAYPEQPASAHPQRCWTWYAPAQSARGVGEAALLAQVARQVALEHEVPAGRVVIAGISAGGAMAANLLYAYPDVFAAGAVHSGIAAFAAEDLAQGLATMRSGPGDADRLARRAAAASGDVPLRRLAVLGIHGANDGVVAPVNLDALVAQARAVASLRGVPVIAESWLVAGLGHAWSGGDAAGRFTDPSTPPATPRVLRFLLDQLDRP
jgi:poly(hydroxyalkanoate) depolymerase family esterase